MKVVIYFLTEVNLNKITLENINDITTYEDSLEISFFTDEENEYNVENVKIIPRKIIDHYVVSNL